MYCVPVHLNCRISTKHSCIIFKAYWSIEVFYVDILISFSFILDTVFEMCRIFEYFCCALKLYSLQFGTKKWVEWWRDQSGDLCSTNVEMLPLMTFCNFLGDLNPLLWVDQPTAVGHIVRCLSDEALCLLSCQKSLLYRHTYRKSFNLVHENDSNLHTFIEVLNNQVINCPSPIWTEPITYMCYTVILV